MDGDRVIPKLGGRRAGSGRRAGPIKMPVNVNPLVRQLFEILRDNQLSVLQTSRRAGMGRQGLSRWRLQEPRLSNFEAALNAIGLRLAIVPEDLPDEIIHQCYTGVRDA